MPSRRSQSGRLPEPARSRVERCRRSAAIRIRLLEVRLSPLSSLTRYHEEGVHLAHDRRMPTRFARARSRASSSRSATWTTQRLIEFRDWRIGSRHGGQPWELWPVWAWLPCRGWGLRRVPGVASIITSPNSGARVSASRACRAMNAATTTLPAVTSRPRRPRRSVVIRWERSTVPATRIAAGRARFAAIVSARRRE